MRILLFGLSLALSMGPGFSQSPFGLGGASHVALTLKSDRTTAVPGETVNLVLKMSHTGGRHTYWINPGTGMPTTLKWTLPEGYSTGQTLWPIPKAKDSELGVSHIYEGEIYVITPLAIPADAIAGEVEIGLDADWLECDDQGCLPKGGKAALKIKIGVPAVSDPEAKGFANKVAFQQPRELKSWKVEIGGSPEMFEVRLTPGEGANPDPGDIYFFESTAEPALKYEMPKLSRSGNALVLQMAKENPVSSPAITGFLYAPKGWETGPAKIEALALGGQSDKETIRQGDNQPVASVTEKNQEPRTKHQEPKLDSQPDDIAAGAALYDANARPPFVLLSGVEEKELTLIPALGLVFIGGLLLNLMPCVFPVLGLKIMGFVAQAGSDARKVKNHGMIFGLGVLVSMWILSGIIIALGLNWGAQMANPFFVGGILILLFLMGLNLAGVFEIGTSLVGVGGELQSKKGYSGSFFSGVLTTLIATPCSGPFLGSVMGFALSQKAPIAFLVFTFFAMGIASPYVILAFFPDAINKLPRPGAWMDSFKKGMSFALFATVAFFLGTFAKQTGYDGLSWMLFALVMIGLAAWIYGTWGSPFMKKSTRLVIGYGLAIITGVVGLQMVRIAAGKEAPLLAGSSDGEFEWKKWFPGTMELSRQKKRIAWIDYTADW